MSANLKLNDLKVFKDMVHHKMIALPQLLAR